MDAPSITCGPVSAFRLRLLRLTGAVGSGEATRTTSVAGSDASVPTFSTAFFRGRPRLLSEGTAVLASAEGSKPSLVYSNGVERVPFADTTRHTRMCRS